MDWKADPSMEGACQKPCPTIRWVVAILAIEARPTCHRSGSAAGVVLRMRRQAVVSPCCPMCRDNPSGPSAALAEPVLGWFGHESCSVLRYALCSRALGFELKLIESRLSFPRWPLYNFLMGHPLLINRGAPTGEGDALDTEMVTNDRTAHVLCQSSSGREAR
jgi:hypothetical protein